MTRSTIAALATGRPPSAVAIIRISGPAAFAAVAGLCGSLPPPRRMSLRTLRDPNAQLLDSALIVVFPGTATASGEDLAELHLHGGAAVVSGVLDALTRHPDVRLAEAGEFTRRAFANGRLDLAQVEGLADLIAAETATQRGQALALAGGVLTRLADSWRDQILSVLAQAEAGLDFAEDEADVAAHIAQASTERLHLIAAELNALVADSGRAARIREGLTIAVIGPPNVGKSSLVNALSTRDMAIVTPIAGTTRDTIEVPMNLNGAAATLVDTAGLRATDDPIELEGIRRAKARAAAADLVLHISAPGVDEGGMPVGAWRVLNKCDLDPSAVTEVDYRVSALAGDGIAALRAALADWAAAATRPGEPALLAHARHRAAFADAAAAVQAAAGTDDEVLRAEDLRRAAHALGRIAGRVDVDDILDRIFGQFCIGK
nr:tRNA uridine-5-carboxymethylaminomethyl(34) synthesis GTPase MnmE [Polymorphobacter fuscus]